MVKRYLLFIVSLFFSGLGVAITKRGELGVSPISSVANVMSYKLPELTLGTWLLIWNTVLIVAQIVILRKEFQKIQLLQLPLSVLFGWFTDIGMKLTDNLPNKIYILRITWVILGVAVLALGISLAVIANVIMNSGEALVKAISDKSGMTFGNVKICFDISCVIIAILLSLIFFDFKILGTREGTIIAAFLTGVVVKLYIKKIKQPIEKVLV